MAKRKTLKEKLELELAEIKDSILQYENAIATMKEKEKEVQLQLEEESLKELLALMKAHDCTVEDIKNMLDAGATEEI